MQIQPWHCTVVLYSFFFGVSSARVSAEPIDTIFSAAFAEYMKVRSFDAVYTNRDGFGGAYKYHMIMDQGKLFYEMEVLAEPVLPQGLSLKPDLGVFDGSTRITFHHKNAQARSMSASRAQLIPTPLEIAHIWMQCKNNSPVSERLGNWDYWLDELRRVSSVITDDENIVTVHSQGIGLDGHRVISFNSDFAWFPVEYAVYVGDRCVFMQTTEVDWFIDENGTKVVFPVKIEAMKGDTQTRSLVLDVERLRINHVVSAEQFTINSIPQNRFVDVDKLNHSIASQLDADAKHEDEKSQRNIFLSGAILLGGFLTILLISLAVYRGSTWIS
jgi:hypothetical protein